MPMLRIRDLPVSFAAIILLHIYWGAIQTGYVYFPLFTPEGEFWIMSLYFPFGIALFHASNSRFLHVAKQQKELFASDEKMPSKSRVRPGSLLGRFQALDYSKKILVTVGLGMVVQVWNCITHMHGDANVCSSSSPSSCGAYPRNSIPHGVFPAQRSIPAPRSTESLRSERAGNGKHTHPRSDLMAICTDSLLQGGPLYSGSSFGHGSSPLTSSGRPAVSTTRRDGGPKPSHAALLSELSLDQGQHRNPKTDRDTQPSCHSYVAHRLVCACHGTRQLLLDSSSMVSHLPQQGSLLKTSPLTVAQ